MAKYEGLDRAIRRGYLVSAAPDSAAIWNGWHRHCDEQERADLEVRIRGVRAIVRLDMFPAARVMTPEGSARILSILANYGSVQTSIGTVGSLTGEVLGSYFRQNNLPASLAEAVASEIAKIVADHSETLREMAQRIAKAREERANHSRTISAVLPVADVQELRKASVGVG